MLGAVIRVTRLASSSLLLWLIERPRSHRRLFRSNCRARRATTRSESRYPGRIPRPHRRWLGFPSWKFGRTLRDVVAAIPEMPSKNTRASPRLPDPLWDRSNAQKRNPARAIRLANRRDRRQWRAVLVPPMPPGSSKAPGDPRPLHAALLDVRALSGLSPLGFALF